MLEMTEGHDGYGYGCPHTLSNKNIASSAEFSFGRHLTSLILSLVMPQPTLAILRSLQSARTIVRIARAEIEPGHADGILVGCSSRLVAVAILNSELHPNGFNVFARGDVTKLEAPAPYADFQAKVLRLRGERLPRLPKLDLASWRALVTTAARRFPLITLHRERIDPDVCSIGRPTALTLRGGTLIEVDPAGAWEREEAEWHRFTWADITRVDFGGGYEEALSLVAGPL
jgi:hypothetical protein